MPELPEVETIKNELLPHIVGHRITDVTLFWEGIVRQPSVEEFRTRLIGQKITGIARRGKYLIFGLNSVNKLVIHLRMTGSLLLKPPDKFVRVILHLDKNAVYLRQPQAHSFRYFSSRCYRITSKEPAAGADSSLRAGLIAINK